MASRVLRHKTAKGVAVDEQRFPVPSQILYDELNNRDDCEVQVTFWEFFLLLVIFVPMLMLWLFTLGDLAKRADISGLAKGLWAVAVVLLPVLGMLFYFITRPSEPEMHADPRVGVYDRPTRNTGRTTRIRRALGR